MGGQKLKKLTFLIIFMIGGCIANPPTNTISDLTKQHFKETVMINEYASQTVITFSTVKGYQRRHSLHNVVWDDNFLRGFVNRTDGSKSYQIYNVIYYANSGTDKPWKSFNQVNYQTPTGRDLIQTTPIKQHEDCSALPRYGQCLYSEHLVFQIDEALLRKMAKFYQENPGRENFWQYELIPKSGPPYNDKLSVAEIAGLLERMDEYVIPRVTTSAANRTDKSSTIHDPALIPEPLIKTQPALVILPLIK
jgi:hypothetical protein